MGSETVKKVIEAFLSSKPYVKSFPLRLFQLGLASL